MVHRLDKVTSGLLILEANAESAAEFSRLFSEHKTHMKRILALSKPKPKKETRFDLSGGI